MSIYKLKPGAEWKKYKYECEFDSDNEEKAFNVDWGYLSNNPNAIPILEQNLDNVNWENLSGNPNAIPILEQNLDKVHWTYLSGNPNAIPILENNLDKVVWKNLSGNPNAIPILEKNLHKVDWHWLSGNPNAIPILEKNLNRIDWTYLSGNPNAIPILEKNPVKVDCYNLSGNPNAISILENDLNNVVWKSLSGNPNAIPILEKNLDKVNWYNLSFNPNAIPILEKNLDKVNWSNLSCNPNAIPILEKNLDKVNWYNLSANPNAIHILEKNLYQVDWRMLCTNPNALHLLFDIVDEKDDFESKREAEWKRYEYEYDSDNEEKSEFTIHPELPNIPVDNINICFVGGVSTGKSTILNAIFCEKLTECKIKRTTMVPTIYIENENDYKNLTPPEYIYQTIAEVNQKIIEKTETSNTIDKNDYKELIFNVGKLDINILSGSYVNVYDIPGLNDVRTKDTYYSYLDENFTKFNLVVLIVDIQSGLNTSDEMQIVKFITNHTRDEKQKNNKKIYTLVVVNKADYMQLEDETNDKLVLTGELNEMFEQVHNTVTEEFSKQNIQEHLIGIIPLCALDSYLYRMVKKHGSKFELSGEQILKIGINEEGKKFSKLKPATQKKRVYEILADELFIKDMIKLSGFSHLESILHKFLNENGVGKQIRINNLLFEMNKLPKLKDKIKSLCTITDNKIADLLREYCNIINSLKKIDVNAYINEMKKLAQDFLGGLFYYLNHGVVINDIIKNYKLSYTNIIKPYFGKGFIYIILEDSNYVVGAFEEDKNTILYPKQLKKKVLNLIIKEIKDKKITIENITNKLASLKEIDYFEKEPVEQIINIVLSNMNLTNSIRSISEKEEEKNVIKQFISVMEDVVQLNVKLSKFLRFIIMNLSNSYNTAKILNINMCLTKYGEITLNRFINYKVFDQKYGNYNDFINGLEDIDVDSCPIELYYLSYEKQHNPINFIGGEIKF